MRQILLRILGSVLRYPDDSQQHKIVADWMRINDRELRTAWEGKTHHATLAASSAIDLQLKFGVEAIILPVLSTTTPSDRFEPELEYIDAGIRYSELRNIKLPIYASVVITDSISEASLLWKTHC